MDLGTQVRTRLDAGDARGAATLVIEALGPEIHGFLRALHGDDDGADVWLDWQECVWKGLPGLRDEARLRSWAYRVAWNCSRHLRRDGWRLRRERLPTSAASRLPAPTTRGGLPGGGDERLAQLRLTLDHGDHALLALRVYNALTWNEISEVLSEDGKPPVATATLRKRYERLTGRLVKQAKRRGLLR